MTLAANSLSWWVTHADTILGVLVCAVPLALVGLYALARAREWLWRSNPLTIGGYRVKGASFASARRDNWILVLWMVVLAAIVFAVVKWA